MIIFSQHINSFGQRQLTGNGSFLDFSHAGAKRREIALGFGFSNLVNSRLAGHA
jgi:hypothetical protein